MTYQIVTTKAAERQLLKLPGNIQKRIELTIDRLQTDPRPHGAIKLEGHEELYRIRIGDYRVVYAIEDKQLIVLIIRIAHRKDVYRG